MRVFHGETQNAIAVVARAIRRRSLSPSPSIFPACFGQEPDNRLYGIAASNDAHSLGKNSRLQLAATASIAVSAGQLPRSLSHCAVWPIPPNGKAWICAIGEPAVVATCRSTGSTTLSGEKRVTSVASVPARFLKIDSELPTPHIAAYFTSVVILAGPATPM